MSEHPLTKVSVIIPCRNEARFIGPCLDSLRIQDFPVDDLEIIVVDGLSVDGTREILLEYAAHDVRIKVVDNPRRITPCALNIGVAAASGDVIMRMDAHAFYEKDYIRQCLHYLQDSGADNVGAGMITLPGGRGLIARAIAKAISSAFGVGNSYFRVGASSPRWVDTVFGGCYRKEVFSKVGLFNVNLRRGQDIEFNLRLKRAGLRTLLVPHIRCYYYAKPDLLSFVKHNYINGEWAVLPFGFSRVVPVSPRSLVPLVFVLLLTMLFALGLVLPVIFKVLAAVLMVYVLAALAVSAVIAAEQKDIGFLAVLPLTFAALHIPYGCGSLAGVFRMLAGRGKSNA